MQFHICVVSVFTETLQADHVVFMDQLKLFQRQMQNMGEGEVL